MGRQAPSRLAEDAVAVGESRCEDHVWRGHSDRVLGCSLDRNGRVVTAQGAWEAMLGWKREQLAGIALTALIDPADRARVRLALSQALDDRPTRRGVTARVRTSGGDYRRICLDVRVSETDVLV